MTNLRSLALLIPVLALPATAAHAGTGAPTYTLRPAHSHLTFTFTQAGAANHGRFKSFTVHFNPTAGTLDVVVNMRSFDTGDTQRDSILGGRDFFDVSHYPRAHFTATKLRKTATGYVATGPLALRGVTRTISIPFTWHIVDTHGHKVGVLDGQTVLKRLEFGVGQGEWRATEWLGNTVTVHFQLRMIPAPH